MIKKPLVITLIACSCSTGCTMISERLSDLQLSNQNVNIETTKTMLYNFIVPRRGPTPRAFIKKNTTLKPGHPTYFSASGYECQVTPSKHSRPVCFIDGTWQEAAPIFQSKAP